MKTELLKQAREMGQTMIEDRRYLHENAEVGFDLPKTCDYVIKRLKEMGYEPKTICPCGVAAVIGPESGKTVLIRADMDALPQTEATGLPFSCKSGAAHSCGHDIHTSALLGAAALLKKHQDKLKGRVKLVFQPDEEGIKGAVAMIEAGVMEDPHVDACIGVHTSVPLEAGYFSVIPGPMLASSDIFRITVTGKACHGSSPEMGKDPITAMAYIILSLQTVLAREIPAQKSGVITIGKTQAGDAPNIIPDTAVLSGTIRALDADTRAYLKKRVEELPAAVCAGFGCTCDIEYISETPVTVNDEGMAEELAGYIKEFAGENCVETGGKPVMGSDDFAYFSEMVPSVMFHTGVGDGIGADGVSYRLHNPRLVFDENSIPDTAGMLAYLALRYLEKRA